MSSNQGAIWSNEEAVAALTKHHADGHSATQIAKLMNRDFPGARLTRNSVIGKLTRLRLRREAPSKPMRAATPKPAPKPKAAPVVKAAMPPVEPPPTPPRRDVATATARPFTDRKIGECWWPIGEGVGMLSCCAPVTRGGLCAQHAERGYQKPSTPNDRRRAAPSFLYHAGRTQQGHVWGKRGGALAE